MQPSRSWIGSIWARFWQSELRIWKSELRISKLRTRSRVGYFLFVMFLRMTRALNLFSGDNVRKKFQEWLSPPDPSKNHSIVLEIRHPETGMWLVQGDTYREWKYSVQPSSLLWINGIRQYFFICLSGADGQFICSGCRKKLYLVR